MSFDIKKFCGASYDPRKLDRLYRFNGFIYATNGHIAVRIPNSPECACVDDQEWFIGPKIEAYFAAPAESEYTKFYIELPTPDACDCCDGKGMVSDCPDCDGGTFIHGNHEYDCKECDGSGEVPGNKRDCFSCDGAGLDLRSYISYGGSGFMHRYMRLIKGLPNIEIAVHPDPIKPAKFRFDGGEGVLMTMRDKP